ncbi:MAG: RdgB/HAM1 family non-canonical purine NTP pyrophosphatase [Clostridia bacterium]|nr:RdgB/HAM1 family non-canonical purine NTP pyrophosphatase [Clostridia bacterium]
MKVVLASRNNHKIVEMQGLLSKLCGEDITVLSLDDIGFTGDIEENGTTFAENALIKCRAPKCDLPVIADDSGLMVDVLDGEPGVYSARYAVDHAGDELGDHANNEKLLAKLEGYRPEEKTSRFVSAVACVFPDGRHIVCEGKCEGMILTEYRGTGGFGYDPLFYVPQIGKTFAEMTQEEKNSVSHRANAMKLFAAEFKKAINEN